MHIAFFLEKCDTIKIDGVSNDAIQLMLFPFSLTDKAKSWLLNSNANSFTTWETLSKSFLCKYFPPRKITKHQNDIASFFQEEDESFMKCRNGSKDSNGNIPIMGSLIGCWFRRSIMIYNSQRRYRLTLPLEVPHGQTHQ